MLGSRLGLHLSERHLKRILSARGHWRSWSWLNILATNCSTGQLHGYRWMYTKCREHGLCVRKEDVRLVLKELDPRGVSLRQARRLRRRSYFSKGPSFIWHMDSYDKLKPYGICANGSIDDFSRKIIWLNAYTTSSDPRLIGSYYIEAEQRLGGCPRLVRGDLGTENGYVRGFQRFLFPLTQTAPLIVTWMEPVPPIKELNIGGIFFGASALSSGYPCLQASETSSLMVGFWTKASFSFVAWD